MYRNYGQPPERPEPPSDSLAEFAARAERAGGIADNSIRVTIVVEDEADGAKYEALAIGTPELIRAIAALPLI